MNRTEEFINIIQPNSKIHTGRIVVGTANTTVIDTRTVMSKVYHIILRSDNTSSNFTTVSLTGADIGNSGNEGYRLPTTRFMINNINYAGIIKARASAASQPLNYILVGE